MGATLVVVTLVSLVLGAVASATAFRLWRESAARVEALETAIAAGAPGPVPWFAEGQVTPDDAVLDPVGTAGVDARLEMFSASTASSDAARRLAPVVVIAAVALSGAIGAWMASGGSDATAGSARASAVVPLELVALRHERARGTTTVAGVVRNPSGAVVRSHVAVVVALLDAQGEALDARRVPLDVAELGPGGSSPFTATLPTPPGAARYRVTFRQDGVGLVPHADRREKD